MIRRGVVVAARSAGTVAVELERGVTCQRCAEGRGCGAALFSTSSSPVVLECRVEERRPDEQLPENDLRNVVSLPGGSSRWRPLAAETDRLRVGSVVEVELLDQGSQWLFPVLFAYGLPTAGLLLGALAPEPWTPITAIFGLIGGVLAWRRVESVFNRPSHAGCESLSAPTSCHAVVRRVGCMPGNQSTSGEIA